MNWKEIIEEYYKFIHELPEGSNERRKKSNRLINWLERNYEVPIKKE